MEISLKGMLTSIERNRLPGPEADPKVPGDELPKAGGLLPHSGDLCCGGSRDGRVRSL